MNITQFKQILREESKNIPMTEKLRISSLLIGCEDSHSSEAQKELLLMICQVTKNERVIDYINNSFLNDSIKKVS